MAIALHSNFAMRMNDSSSRKDLTMKKIWVAVS
jgi:hypothetical protein